MTTRNADVEPPGCNNCSACEYTRPEIAFDKLYGNKVVRPLPITVGDGMKLWALKPDRHHPYVQKEVSVFLQISREWTRKIAA